jgi:predicted transcriptional regulator
MQWKTHTEIAKAINWNRNTVKYYCEELQAIGVLEQLFNASKEKSTEHWQLSDMAINLIQESKIFN